MSSFSKHRWLPSRAHIFAALFLLTIPPASGEEWRLSYTLSQGNPPTQPQGASEVSNHNLILSLGSQYLCVDDGHDKRVYDFTKRRMTYLNLDKREYSNWSLYSNVSARIQELENRFNVGASLRKAKISGETIFGRYDNESNLGIELPGMKFGEPDPKINCMDLPENGWEFQHEGLSVVQFFPAKETLPAAFQARFANFLAYECSIHPRIRTQITATGKLPQTLTIRWQLGSDSKSATYRLQSVALAQSDSSLLPEGFQITAGQGEFSETLLRVTALARNQALLAHRGTRDQVEHFAQAAIARHQPLDAYLALLEYRLQSGETHANDFRPYQKEFDHDNQCRRYFASHDQSSRDACLKSLAACESIDRTGLQKSYMIDLQRADLLQILGRTDAGPTAPTQPNQTVAAEKLFLSVLTANPFLTGAYHDLGMLYNETFRSPEAWVCFDTARQLCPDHFLLKDITSLELRFEHDFPDYF